MAWFPRGWPRSRYAPGVLLVCRVYTWSASWNPLGQPRTQPGQHIAGRSATGTPARSTPTFQAGLTLRVLQPQDSLQGLQPGQPRTSACITAAPRTPTRSAQQLQGCQACRSINAWSNDDQRPQRNGLSQPQLMAPRLADLGLPGQQAMVPGQICWAVRRREYSTAADLRTPTSAGTGGGGQLGLLSQQGGHLGLRWAAWACRG